MDYLEKAKDALQEALEQPDLNPLPVWFSKVGNNWKAILITDPEDDQIYEVTCVGSIGKIFVDAYQLSAKYTLGVSRK